jgi:VIT1/CCC1 family predicted Fe2+/Mn2+ transporter
MDQTTLWRENLREERDLAALFEGLAAIDSRPDRARSLAVIASGEQAHALIWEKKLRGAGLEPGVTAVSSRVRAALWLARRVGVGALLPLVSLGEAEIARRYATQGVDAAELHRDEEAHRDALAKLGQEERSPGERSSDRRGQAAGTVRAAVFGANDGVLSNLALVMGVAASGAAPRTVLVSGIAGLFAGAFSMATGEYVSVSSQRDLLRRRVRVETRTLGSHDDGSVVAALASVLVGRGLPAARAQELAQEAVSHPETAIDLFVREELGLDPGELGSPLPAAVSSFFMFSIGAFLPILPLLVSGERRAVFVSVALCATFLASVGALLGFLSGTGAVRSAARILGLAILSTAVTMAIGGLLHVSVD